MHIRFLYSYRYTKCQAFDTRFYVSLFYELSEREQNKNSIVSILKSILDNSREKKFYI